MNMAGVLKEAGMLTQGPTLDSQCKLNISSFLSGKIGWWFIYVWVWVAGQR